jgi:hypothetical protein
MCEKYNEGDQLTLQEFYQLLQELERLYFIKVIQQDETISKRKPTIYSSDFEELLKRMEEVFKKVFYRKETCDIYDCLYYLKESSSLDKACTLFLGIKNILQL